MLFQLFGGPADGAVVDLQTDAHYAPTDTTLVIEYDEIPDAEYVWEPGTDRLRYVQ